MSGLIDPPYFGGGGGGGGGGSTVSVFGDYDYYIYNNSGVYTAVPSPRIGGPNITNSTPDICALWQAIDTAIGPNSKKVWKIRHDKGTFSTPSASGTNFSPSVNNGYWLQGFGGVATSGILNSPIAGNWYPMGTVIEYLGTSNLPGGNGLIECTVHWSRGNNADQYDLLYLHDLNFHVPNWAFGGANDAIVNTTGAQLVHIERCGFFGNPTTTNLAGQVLLLLNTDQSTQQSVIRDCNFVGGDTLLNIGSSDVLKVENCQFFDWFTAALNISSGTTGEALTLTDLWFINETSAAGTAPCIYDQRTNDGTGYGGSPSFSRKLYMSGIRLEHPTNITKAYVTVNNAPYELHGSSFFGTYIAGTTAGNAIYTLVQASDLYIEYSCYLNGYENTTATAQTATLPLPFTTAVVVDDPSSTGVTSTKTTLTLPSSMTAAKTGMVRIWGY